MSCVIRREDLPDFARYLTFNGAIIEDVTNPWEVLRYHMPRVGVIVIYQNSEGELTIPPAAVKHYQQFKRGKFIDHATEPSKRKGKLSGQQKNGLRARLKERDGDVCCVCGQDLDGDETIEHWLSVTDGGVHTPANLALAHRSCNEMLGSLPVNIKVKFVLEIAEIVRNLPDGEKFDPERHVPHLVNRCKQLRAEKMRARAEAEEPELADG